jgi:hypothetical protein
MTGSHSPKRRRLDDEGTGDGPGMGSANLEEEFQHGGMVEDMNQRLTAHISSCWANDNAKGAVEQGNVCKVKILSMGKGAS